MRKREITSAEAAYERGYKEGVEAMSSQFIMLRAEIVRQKSEIQRLKEIIEERVFQ